MIAGYDFEEARVAASKGYSFIRTNPLSVKPEQERHRPTDHLLRSSGKENELGDLVEGIARRFRKSLLEDIRDEFASSNGQEASTAYLSRAELARELRVSAATVTRLKDQGLPHIYVGDQPRYVLAKCEEWFEQRRRRTEVDDG